MKHFRQTVWWAAWKALRGPRRVRFDPAEMGTAFGLDSITIVDFDAPSRHDSTGPTDASASWQSRSATRRSTD